MRRILFILLFLSIAGPAFAQDASKSFAFRGLTWGQKPAASKQALADSATYKMEMSASDAQRELYTTTFADAPAGLTLEFREGELSVVTLATADTVPAGNADAVFRAWTAALSTSFGPPIGSAPEAVGSSAAGEDDGEDEGGAMDIFGNVPEKRWQLPGTEIVLVQKVEGTGYGVVATFRQVAPAAVPAAKPLAEPAKPEPEPDLAESAESAAPEESTDDESEATDE